MNLVITIYKLPFHESCGTACFTMKNVPKKINISQIVEVKVEVVFYFSGQIKPSDIGRITC